MSPILQLYLLFAQLLGSGSASLLCATTIAAPNTRSTNLRHILSWNEKEKKILRYVLAHCFLFTVISLSLMSVDGRERKGLLLVSRAYLEVS